MKEIWVKIDDCYSVSNYGRVYSYKRMGTKGGLIGCYDEPVDRYVIGMYGKTTQIHILVAKAFPEICGYWFDGCVVHHKNEIKTDNRAENLVVLTRDEHMKLHNKGKKFTKERCENISKSLIGKGIGHNNNNTKAILQLSENGDIIKEWLCMKECCEELGLPYQGMLVKFNREHSDLIHWNGYIFKRIQH